jgi:putative NIF3 family GTP cyclohydrolase 1 type 2
MASGVNGVSRRTFVFTGAATLLSAGAVRGRPRQGESHNQAMTARDVVARIQARVGVPWREKTVDTFKAGDPDTIVTGVATSVMATLDVLRQAVAAKRNLVITHEPTFYTGTDEPGPRASDPVYLAKRTYIDEHRLVVWRFSDHWLARQPGEFTRALADTLGWTAARDPANERLFTIPQTTVGAVAAHIRERLKVNGGMRLVGRADAPARRVVLSPGTTDLASTVADLRDADLLVSGEPREWEAVEYVADTAASGAPRSLLAIGCIVSEEPGMRACAAWLRTVLGDLPVDALAIGDPYWRPAV